ncbi:MAG TPA: hypothetical protein VFH39_00275 [Candidatus Saccharimonadales bacterium]|nr:hypothetical protein [Candidatus Saccharimonadales bacterium]
MKKFLSKHSPILRAFAVVSLVGATVTTMTYATLQSPTASLTSNNIKSATANLVIGTASPTSTAYNATHTGFTFNNVIPGGPAVPDGGNTFYLKNTGSTTLKLKLNISGTPTNPGNVDLSKVNVTVTRTDTGASQTASLQALLDTSDTGGLALTDTLAPGSTGTGYTITVGMDADAYTGSGNDAAIGPFDFVFSGTVDA